MDPKQPTASIPDSSHTSGARSVSTPGRSRLYPALHQHAAKLTTSMDDATLGHSAARSRLAEWLLSEYGKSNELHVIIVCTGNSRRSILGSSMGNLAAAHFGLESIHFHSGGTEPSAFNPRTITALREIGFQIEPTGDTIPSANAESPNPIYDVRWGEGLATTEFSKCYSDPSNPQHGFAAVMVCTEADTGCPVVHGAAVRISMPFEDPKAFDDTQLEASRYAERRDEIGRIMLSVMRQVRQNLDG
jgi:arsenate reductase (thioredoxin)